MQSGALRSKPDMHMFEAGERDGWRSARDGGSRAGTQAHHPRTAHSARAGLRVPCTHAGPALGMLKLPCTDMLPPAANLCVRTCRQCADALCSLTSIRSAVVSVAAYVGRSSTLAEAAVLRGQLG